MITFCESMTSKSVKNVGYGKKYYSFINTDIGASAKDNI